MWEILNFPYSKRCQLFYMDKVYSKGFCFGIGLWLLGGGGNWTLSDCINGMSELDNWQLLYYKSNWKLGKQLTELLKNYIGRTSFITPDFSSLLQLCTQTLESFNLGYPSLNFFKFQLFVRIFR
jgi:hypothetical protein